MTHEPHAQAEQTAMEMSVDLLARMQSQAEMEQNEGFGLRS